MYYVIAHKLHAEGKNARKIETIKSVLERAGKEYEVLYTEYKGHATELAEKITSDGEDNVIIAAGGDGTLHEILNGFKDFSKNNLGLVPFGTGNDFAEGAGVPLNVKEATEIIAFRAPQYIDFIELSSGLRSLNAVGMGIDVDVLQRAYASKFKGRTKYLRAFVKSLFKFQSCNFTVEYEDEVERHFGMIAALGNGKQIGGGIKLFPDAKIDDGYMDLFIVDFISRPKMFKAFLKLMRGKVNSVKEAKAVRVKSAKFIADSEDYFIQAEGELYKNMPIDAHVVSGKLKFYL